MCMIANAPFHWRCMEGIRFTSLFHLPLPIWPVLAFCSMHPPHPCYSWSSSMHIIICFCILTILLNSCSSHTGRSGRGINFLGGIKLTGDKIKRLWHWPCVANYVDLCHNSKCSYAWLASRQPFTKHVQKPHPVMCLNSKAYSWLSVSNTIMHYCMRACGFSCMKQRANHASGHFL